MCVYASVSLCCSHALHGYLYYMDGLTDRHDHVIEYRITKISMGRDDVSSLYNDVGKLHHCGAFQSKQEL